MSLNLSQMVILFAAFLLLLLAMVSGAHWKKRRLNNRILALFLLSNALLLLCIVLYDFHVLKLARFPFFYFLLGPLLFLYIKYLCSEDDVFHKQDLLHGMPFLVCMICLIYFSLAGLWTSTINTIMHLALHLQILLYLIVGFQRISACRTRLLQYYSTENRTNLSWLRFIFLCFSAMWGLDFINWILHLIRLDVQFIHFILWYLSLAINFTFAALLTYQGLRHSDMFHPASEKTKYQWSHLSPAQKKKYVKQLTHYMSNEKPYLTPSLTIHDLSEKLTIPHRCLSQVINESMGKNFYDFVNAYRLDEAKKLLAESGRTRKTILEILFEVGFNSKSTFNLAFKQYTGFTPKEFKRLNN